MATRYFRSKQSEKLIPSSKRFIPDKNRYSSSGGTIVSTTGDLLKWLLMIRNQGIHQEHIFLKPQTVKKMLHPHTVGSFAAGGLGLRETDKEGNATAFGHTGSTGTSVFIDLKKDTISIMLTQTRGIDSKGFRKELESKIKATIKVMDK